MSFRSITRGWAGEHATCALLTASLNRQTYTSIHNVIIPAGTGTTQVDHVVISPFGIFVIETKNTSGWIFGGENQPTWTQSLFGKNFRFQNPLRQNYHHTRALAVFLRLDDSAFHSIVFFSGRCEFKTSMPRNVIKSGLASYIEGFQEPCLDENRVSAVIGTIRSLKRDRHLNDRAHVMMLKDRKPNS
jgi:restriction system protein